MYCINNGKSKDNQFISDTSSRHFATKKWYIINDENNTNYGVNKDARANNPLKPNLFDYADAYILVNGTIRVAAANAATRLIFKNCAPFIKCNLEINDATADLTDDTSNSYKYKVNLLGNPVLDGAIVKLSIKIVVPLKYLSNFFRSLEMPLINCKVKLNLTWKKECVLSNQDSNAVFIINDTKLYVPVVPVVIKILLNNKIKVFKNLFIGTNIKQKEKLKIQTLMLLSILV